ncbi:S-adenosyl-L-methionine-dependent methyltransferase [Schizophyllum commune]
MRVLRALTRDTPISTLHNSITSASVSSIFPPRSRSYASRSFLCASSPALLSPRSASSSALASRVVGSPAASSVSSAPFTRSPVPARSLSRSTMSSAPSPSPATPVHDMAAKGFNVANDLYDRARPSYQPSVLSWIRKTARKVDGAEKLNVLEVGAGTGIFTRALLAHPEWKDDVGELRAIEPAEGMRDQFIKSTVSTVNNNNPKITVHDGHFSSLPVPDGWADLIVIAQAFHWCPDHPAAITEFARALKKGAPLVLVWNLEDRDAVPWIAQLRDRIERHEQGAPQFRLGLWRAFAGTKEWQTLFTEKPSPSAALPDTDTDSLPHTTSHTISFILPGTTELTVDRACSKSYIASLPEDERAEVVKDVRAILEKGEGRKWIDEAKGVFEYPYKATVVVGWKA